MAEKPRGDCGGCHSVMCPAKPPCYTGYTFLYRVFVNKTLKPSSTDNNNLLYQAKNVYLHLATLPLTSCRNLHPLPPLIPNLYFLTSFVTSSFPKLINSFYHIPDQKNSPKPLSRILHFTHFPSPVFECHQ